jgi:hypothetical protein
VRLSRPDYDKEHRCPGGISGGGWKFSKVEHCVGGYVTVRVMDEGYPGHPGKYRWHFGHCNRCDTVTWPVALCHLVDPTWWRFAVWRFWDRRIMDSVRDWRDGESLRRIWYLRWRH